ERAVGQLAKRRQVQLAVAVERGGHGRENAAQCLPHPILLDSAGPPARRRAHGAAGGGHPADSCPYGTAAAARTAPRVWMSRRGAARGTARQHSIDGAW